MQTTTCCRGGALEREACDLKRTGRPASHDGARNRTKVVIVGAGFGGLSTARSLARAENIDVTIIDRNNYHLFQPLLYQVATTSLSPSEIAYPIRAALGAQRNARVLLSEVVGVDEIAREVSLGDGSRIDYDYLVLAPGARHSYFGHQEWETNAPGLKTLEDALEIRRRVLLASERAELTNRCQRRTGRAWCRHGQRAAHRGRDSALGRGNGGVAAG